MDDHESTTATAWGKELATLIYDESKTFCRLCNLRFNAFLQHDSDAAHTARVSIFAFLLEFTRTDDASRIALQMTENHMEHPRIIPAISALPGSSPRHWRPLQSLLKYFKHRKLVAASVFSNGEHFARTSAFDRFEWVGDHSMRAVSARVFDHLFTGVSAIPFRHLPFLQFTQSNFVLERLYDELGMHSIICGTSKAGRGDKAHSAMKMKADIIESVYGEITLNLHQHDAEVVSKRGVFAGVSLEGKGLAALAEHFLVDLTAAYMMRHFVRFVNETMRYLEGLRRESLGKRPIFYEPRKFVHFEQAVLSDERGGRLQSLNSLGHIGQAVASHRPSEISTADLMAQLGVLFRKKWYFGNEIHSRLASTGIDLAHFPSVGSLNALYDAGKISPATKDVDERFKVHEHLTYLYARLYPVPLPETICPYIRRRNSPLGHMQVQRTTGLGFPTHGRVGRFGSAVFVSFGGAGHRAVSVVPRLARAPGVHCSRSLPGGLKWPTRSMYPYVTQLPRFHQTLRLMGPRGLMPRFRLLGSAPHCAPISTVHVDHNWKRDFSVDTKLLPTLACRLQECTDCQYQQTSPSDCEIPIEAYTLHLTRKRT